MTAATSFVYNKLFTCQFSPLMVEADPGYCFPVGDLISEWESSSDGTSWTMKIHPDAVWHNMPSDSRGYTAKLIDLYGRAVVAGDVVHSLHYWQGKLTKPDGGHQRYSQLEDYTRGVTTVEVIDDKTVLFNLRAPDPHFAATYSRFNTRIVPPEVFNLDGDYTQRTVGSGAFRLNEYDSQITWDGTANPDYFKVGADGSPLPYVDRHHVIVLRSDIRRAGFSTGQIDSRLNEERGDHSATLVLGRSCRSCQIIEYFRPSSTSRILGFKHLPTEDFPNPYFADRNARLAIAKAIDYQAIGDSIFRDRWIIAPVDMPWSLIWDSPPTVKQMGLDLADDENPFVYDPKRAKELWALAGKKPGERIELVYYHYGLNDTTYTVAIGVSIAAALDINVRIVEVRDVVSLYAQTGFFVGREFVQNHEFLITHSRVLGIHNAVVPLENRAEDAGNYFAFNNPRMDELAAEWALGPSIEREKELAQEYYTETLKDLLYLPSIVEATYDVQSGRVRNSYQQLRGGRAFHNGGQLAEIIWLDD